MAKKMTEAWAAEIDNLSKQCEQCKQKKHVGHKSGCEIRDKLVNQLNEVAWNHKHLFLINGKCKMFQPKR